MKTITIFVNGKSKWTHEVPNDAKVVVKGEDKQGQFWWPLWPRLRTKK